MDKGILLLGGGGHCRSVIDVLECAGIKVAGVVHGPDCALEPLLGYPAKGRDGDLPILRQKFLRALVTVGQTKTPGIRKKLFFLLKNKGFFLPSVVSPRAYVSRHAEVGEGSVVMHDSLVNAGASVGDNCIVNTRALIEHDCSIGSHSHIAVGAILCGGVRLGEGCFIGAGAVVHPLVTVGAGCVVGMGTCILRDLADGEQVVGLARKE